MAKPKTCPGCGTADLAKFAKNRARRDGMQTYCRMCIKSQRGWNPIQEKRDYESLLVEQYIQHRISQE